MHTYRTISFGVLPASRSCTRAFTTRTQRTAIAAGALSLAMAAFAAPVPIPNADFADPGNDGTIGGGLLGTSGSAPIGSGPWSGDYAGILGLLAPPALTISSGKGSVSALGVVALGIANRGAFEQTLAAPYVPIKHYVLAADIDAGDTLLGLSVLASGNAGVALLSGANTLASTRSSASIALSGGGHAGYHVALGYDSQNGDSGPIGVSLFSDPTGVIAANLISQVAFTNAVLTQAPIPALPPDALGPAGGTPQAATVNTAFGAALSVSVVDAEGDPLAGIPVTFAPPASGASVNLSSTTVLTDVGGRATVTGTANGNQGEYTVTASVDGLPETAQFMLSNTAVGQPALIATTQGDNQSTATGSAFACMIAVEVVGGDAPAAGATVQFQAPASGASAVLSDGTNSGATLIETTDANGFAAVNATANAIAGSYNVTATATALTSGTLLPVVLLASYPLTNLDVGERLFANGFDVEPALCGGF